MTCAQSPWVVFKTLMYFACIGTTLCACNTFARLLKTATPLIKEPSIATADVGIAIYEPKTARFIFNYHGNHYFVPASNVKIPTCYAAMKYLGDSITAASIVANDTAVLIIPNGDPTLLNPDFVSQPLINYLKNEQRSIYVVNQGWEEEALGSGWAWNDYNDDYMAERSPLPIYANVLKWTEESSADGPVVYSTPEVNWPVGFDTLKEENFYVRRKQGQNQYQITEGNEQLKEQSVPFITNGVQSAREMLSDYLQKNVTIATHQQAEQMLAQDTLVKTIHSQPLDSMLRIMMHRSDNFLAEQSLLMVSNHVLHVMNDQKVIDTLIKNDFQKILDHAHWVDGSGLSRYNLFSPFDMALILNKMREEFGMDRIKKIFPTGNEGTLKNYYQAETGSIYAKTGSLSGVICISGFLYTRKNTLLIFSVLINNYTETGSNARRNVEKFIDQVYNNY